MNSQRGELIRCVIFVSTEQNQGKWVKVNERQTPTKYKALSSHLNHLELKYSALGESALPTMGVTKAGMLGILQKMFKHGRRSFPATRNSCCDILNIFIYWWNPYLSGSSSLCYVYSAIKQELPTSHSHSILLCLLASFLHFSHPSWLRVSPTKLLGQAWLPAPLSVSDAD